MKNRLPSSNSWRRRKGSRLNYLVLPILMVVSQTCTPHFVHQDLRNEIESLKGSRIKTSLPPPYQDFPGAIHVHTELSHDSEGTVEDIVEASLKAGSRFVITTDHHQPKVYERGFQGWLKGLLVIRGSEIIKGCKGSTGAGCNSLLVLGLDDYLNKSGLTMGQVVEQVKSKGGLAIAAHPSGFVDWGAPIDGMEIYDILDDAVDKKWKYPKWFFDILYSYDRYSPEVFLSILDPHEGGLSKWDEMTQKRRIVGVAGNDAHENVRILGKQIDPYDLSLRFVRTHIMAPKLDAKEVLDALRSGHAYVSFDILADATGFGFWAGNPEFIALMGDEITVSPNLRLFIQSPVVGRIRVLRDGRLIGTFEGRNLEIPVVRGGVYRVEVQLQLRQRWWPWIYANPIYIRNGPLP